MIIAGDHKDGYARDDHRIECELGKPRDGRTVLFVKGQKEEHGERGYDHHIERHHVDDDPRVHDIVFDKVKPVGQKKKKGRVINDGEALLHEDALFRRYHVDLRAEILFAKTLESFQCRIRNPDGQIPRHIVLFPVFFHGVLRKCFFRQKADTRTL